MTREVLIFSYEKVSFLFFAFVFMLKNYILASEEGNKVLQLVS